MAKNKVSKVKVDTLYTVSLLLYSVYYLYIVALLLLLFTLCILLLTLLSNKSCEGHAWCISYLRHWLVINKQHLTQTFFSLVKEVTLLRRRNFSFLCCLENWNHYFPGRVVVVINRFKA